MVNVLVSPKPQHAQTDALQVVPALGTVPAPSWATCVCDAERATTRDPAPASHACEESIEVRQRSGSGAGWGRSAVVLYGCDESATATAARTPARYHRDDLAVVR